MKKRFSVFQEMEGEKSIAANSVFLFLLEHGLLLALKDLGKLNEMQYRQAIQELRRQQGKPWGNGAYL